MARTRKARSDRNHMVYVLTNVVTSEQYVGLTVGANKQALHVRCQKHVRRALTENKDWALCRSIREHGAESFTMGILFVVRGKLAAHRHELEVIRMHNPALNTAK
jgi:hypothetical protein